MCIRDRSCPSASPRTPPSSTGSATATSCGQGAPCEARRTTPSRAPSAPTSPATWCPSWRRWCCTSWRSVPCVGSPSRSDCRRWWTRCCWPPSPARCSDWWRAVPGWPALGWSVCAPTWGPASPAVACQQLASRTRRSPPAAAGAAVPGAAPTGAAPTVQAPSGRGPDMATAIDERGGAAHSRWGAVARFFSGQTHYDFIGRSRLWLGVVLASIVVSILGVLIGGLNLGIALTGGTSFVVTGTATDPTAEALQAALSEVGVSESVVQLAEGPQGPGALITTPALDEIGGEQQAQIIDAIVATTGAPRDQIAVQAVGPRWGAEISRQALEGLLAFLVLVTLYITLRFELRMAVAALVTLIHDVVVTIGIYAIVGFEVTPASVIALLTILGYSLYDTVIVFDRVRETTAPLSSVSTRTYGEVANAALNNVLVRSLSTSVTSLLPVGTLLFIGANLLGAETLQDLALALFVGMAIGAYSSLVVATPFLVWLKEREPRWAELKEKVEARRGGAASAS